MKKHKSWFLPDWETHFVEIMNQKNIDGYQIEGRTVSIQESLKLNGWQPKLAIDVGANVGFWSRDLCEKFEKVWAYEPMDYNIECLQANVIKKNITVKNYALGSAIENKNILYTTTKNSGQASFHKDAILTDDPILDRSVPVSTIDDETKDLPKNFADNCYMKIDVQGHEKDVIMGGLNFIKSHKPIICTEVRANKENIPGWMKFFDKLNYRLLVKTKKEFTFISNERWPNEDIRRT